MFLDKTKQRKELFVCGNGGFISRVSLCFCRYCLVNWSYLPMVTRPSYTNYEPQEGVGEARGGVSTARLKMS